MIATLEAMALLAREYKVKPELVYEAQNLVQDCPPKAYGCEAATVQAFVRDAIRYVRDVNQVETLKTPDVTLETRSGDCDDKSLLAATLLEAIGHPSRFVAIATRRPGEYDHVYVETRLADQWYGVETTEMVPFGWSPPRVDYPLIRRI